MADRVQEERRWVIYKGFHTPQTPPEVAGPDTPAAGIAVVPASSLDQALAERDRLAEVVGELADCLTEAGRGRTLTERDGKALAHYESLRGEADG